jgi:hypothetical protein
MKFVGYARPHPDLPPQEKEQQVHVSDFADERPANPVTRILKRRRTVLLLLGEKAGMREDVKSKADGAQLQTGRTGLSRQSETAADQRTPHSASRIPHW